MGALAGLWVLFETCMLGLLWAWRRSVRVKGFSWGLSKNYLSIFSNPWLRLFRLNSGNA